MAEKIIIAIDGYAGTGKGITAKLVAQRLGYLHVDSGATYRAFTLYILDNSIDYANIEAVIATFSHIQLHFQYNTETGTSDMYLNGKNVEKEIRTMRVSNEVSKVSNIPEVRKFLARMQQSMGKNGGIVMEGRDIGSVIFPHAQLKVYITTDIRVRAYRRQQQFAQSGEKVDIESIIENMQARDTLDSQRINILFEKYKNEVHTIDNSYMTIDEQVAKIVQWAHEKNI